MLKREGKVQGYSITCQAGSQLEKVRVLLEQIDVVWTSKDMSQELHTRRVVWCSENKREGRVYSHTAAGSWRGRNQRPCHSGSGAAPRTGFHAGTYLQQARRAGSSECWVPSVGVKWSHSFQHNHRREQFLNAAKGASSFQGAG